MKTTIIPPLTDEAAPSITFAEVLRAVEGAPDLSQGVRGNMRAAVIRCSKLVSSEGLTGRVDVQLIARRIEKLTPAKLGFQNPNSMAALLSNLRRALHLAGIGVMPGRHHNPLTLGWSELATKAQAHEGGFLWPAISRFIHYLSNRGVSPDLVDQNWLIRFEEDLRDTCLGSKVDKVVRNTVKSWKKVQEVIPDWPHSSLLREARKSTIPLLPWSDFPGSLEREARRFVDRDDDWLSTDDLFGENLKRPLRPSTRDSYIGGLRRVASILVAHGTPPSALARLADLVELGRAKTVLGYVSKRTGRRQGGHVMFLALLLYLVARDSADVDDETTGKLEALFKKTRPGSTSMSDRTLERFIQFDDPAALDRLLGLPGQLLALAEKQSHPNVSRAKLARLALYLSLLTETCARSGNIVGLDLKRHIVSEGHGKAECTFVVIPGHEVKNGQEIRAQLSRTTARMLRLYVDRYRPVQCPTPCSWLFPKRDGTHWSVTQACADLKDVAARKIGVDVTPHLMRSLAGKILLDAHPGAIATVQQLLGHKQVDTTLRFYARLDPQKARSQYHAVLRERAGDVL